MSDRKRLFLMDGTQFAYRAYFAFINRPLRNSRGINTSAPYGMMLSILKILDDIKPDAFAVAFDIGKAKERLELYPEYKSTREKMPDELRESLPYINKLVAAMNIPTLAKEGIEADDLIGTIAKRAENKGWDVVLVTGDKDFLQLVDEHISILAPSKGALPTERYDAENASRKFDVPPRKIVDFLALMGDSSDNVPGVKGIGKKTAANLLSDYENLDDIYEHLEVIGGATAKKLESDREMAYLSRKLVTIDTDVDFQFDWENAPISKPDFSALIPLLEELEFTSLLDRFHQELGNEECEIVSKVCIDYVLVDDEEKLEGLLNKLRDTERFAVDTETTCQHPMDADLVGISFSIEEGEAFYLPLAHRRVGDMFLDDDLNLPFDNTLDKLRPILEDGKIGKTGQNLKYDYVVLKLAGIDLCGIDGDAMIADYLLSPGAYEHGLDVLSLKHLGHRMQSYKELVGDGKEELSIAEIEPSRVARYAGEDAEIALRLANKLEGELRELELYDLYSTLEIPLIRVLAEMQIAGVRLDTQFLKNLSVKLKADLEILEGKIYETAGEEFNIGSPKQLSEIFFDKLKLPVQKKTKTGYSTDAEVLQTLSAMHPLPKMIIDYRELAKLINTYLDALPLLVDSSTGRIHPTFQQAVTSTGRLSCKDPNLQNIPVRGEMGREIRKAFLPADGNVLISADYSQIELRMMAHISGDENLIRAFLEGRDIHADTASRIFGVDIDDVTSDQRRMAKVINFGVIYGMTPWGVAGRLGIEFSEARKFVEAYFDRYPGIADYMERAPRDAEEQGYVETILGRRRYFADLKNSKGMKSFLKRAAINTPIQGSAADLIKIAMLRIFERFEREGLESKMILTVHDELVFDVPDAETAMVKEIAEEIMVSAMELSVPLAVDIGVGGDWLSAHE